MRRLIIATVLLVASTAAAEPYQSRSRFGIGLELGAPTGLSGKYFFGGRQLAIQGGLGVLEAWGDDGWHMHAEAVWHPAVLYRGRDLVIPLHVGVGGRMLQHNWGYRNDVCWNGRVYVDCDDTHLGVRAPIGVSFLFNRTPMDLFAELALVFDLVRIDDYYMDPPHDRAGLHLALGGRFYF